MRSNFKFSAACLLFLLIFSIAFLNIGIKEVYALNISVGAAESVTDQGSVANSLQVIFMLIIISLSPSLLVMLTCFTRIVISLHFTRSALGTQQMPPNQVMIGLALVMTFFIMEPQFTTIYNDAFMPYSRSELTAAEALEEGMKPIRNFMLLHSEDKDISLFAGLAGEMYESSEDIPNRVLIPAFILGEITKGFIFGFWIYIPFIAIDMIVASTLMAMGMMMLPPAMISLPFKILLFVMVDGWSLLIKGIVDTFMVR